MDSRNPNLNLHGSTQNCTTGVLLVSVLKMLQAEQVYQLNANKKLPVHSVK